MGANQKQFLKMEHQNCLHFQRSILGECLLYIEQMDKSIAERNTQRRKHIYCWWLTWYGNEDPLLCPPSLACGCFSWLKISSRDVKTWEGSKRLGENNSVMKFLHKCRQLAPDDKAILQLSFMTSLHMKDGRYGNTWSWVLRTSLAMAGDDRTMLCMRPNRIYMKGPYCWAMHANVWCGDLPSCNKLPSTDNGHGPRRKERDFLEKKKNTTNKQCNKTTKHASSKGFFISRIFHYAKEENSPPPSPPKEILLDEKKQDQNSKSCNSSVLQGGSQLGPKSAKFGAKPGQGIIHLAEKDFPEEADRRLSSLNIQDGLLFVFVKLSL